MDVHKYIAFTKQNMTFSKIKNLFRYQKQLRDKQYFMKTI